MLQERIAELEENVEQLMTDLDSSMQDVVSRDEEIDRLEARLASTQVGWVHQWSAGLRCDFVRSHLSLTTRDRRVL